MLVGKFSTFIYKKITIYKMGDDLYQTNYNPYHTYKNGFITHGVYHIDFSKRVKNRVITQLK